MAHPAGVFHSGDNETQIVKLGTAPLAVQLPTDMPFVRIAVPRASHIVYVNVGPSPAVIPTGGAKGSMPVYGGEGLGPTYVYKGSAATISIVAESPDVPVAVTAGDMV
jgi:hypothetical protein